MTNSPSLYIPPPAFTHVTLAWNANPTNVFGAPNTAGYAVYVREDDGPTIRFDVRTNTSMSMDSIIDGTVMNFGVAAYFQDEVGDANSQEIDSQPTTLSWVASNWPPEIVITWPLAYTNIYLWTSTDLKKWTAKQQNNGHTFSFVLAPSPQFWDATVYVTNSIYNWTGNVYLLGTPVPLRINFSTNE